VVVGEDLGLPSDAPMDVKGQLCWVWGQDREGPLGGEGRLL
jgi:hypothetical protein